MIYLRPSLPEDKKLRKPQIKSVRDVVVCYVAESADAVDDV